MRVEGSVEMTIQETDLVPKVMAEPARIEPSTILLAPSVAAVPGAGLSVEGQYLFLFFFTLVTGPRRSLSLKLSDTRVYEPQIRVRLVATKG